MAILVKRRQLSFLEKIYFPEIARGLKLTLTHIFKKKVTMQYPEERPKLAPNFRGLPVLVTDQDGRIKCVACQLCQFVCPPEAISITPRELDGSNVEKEPERFDLNVLRCIFCGYCEEVCPEEAIFLSKHFEFAPTTRAEMLFPKEKLLELGGKRNDETMKWAHK